MGRKQFTGKTEDAQHAMLGASFWEKGIKIEGTVTGFFETKNGLCWNLHLTKPVKVDKLQEDQIAIGNLAGFQMALRAANVPKGQLEIGDAVIIECTGKEKATIPGYSDMVKFKILVDRDDNF